MRTGKTKKKKNRRCGGGVGEEGGSWHLTVKHAFLMSALVVCIPILRSLHQTEPGKQTGHREESKMRRSRVGTVKPKTLVESFQ